jgi:hypothetical protein
MKRHRILIDTADGRVVPYECDVVQIPDGELAYRAHDRSLRPLDSEPAYAGDRYIASGWHETAEAARAEAVAVLMLRIAKLKQLAEACDTNAEGEA